MAYASPPDFFKSLLKTLFTGATGFLPYIPGETLKRSRRL